MLISEFITLADAGYALDEIKKIAGKNFKPGAFSDKESVKKLMTFVERAPRVTFEADIEAFESEKRKAIETWQMPKLSEVKFESVVDFGTQTEERIKITIEDYQEYFDRLMAEDNEDAVSLKMEVSSKDGSKAFASALRSSAEIERLRSKYTWASRINDVDLLYMLGYIIAVSDSSSALNVSVAESVARGMAQYDAAVYAGKLLNSRFSDLFKDFISADRN